MGLSGARGRLSCGMGCAPFLRARLKPREWRRVSESMWKEAAEVPTTATHGLDS